MTGRLEDTKTRHPQSDLDSDIGWLIAEVERLREARILDHRSYMARCSYIELNPGKYPDRLDVCRGIESTISLYLRGLLRIYHEDEPQFPFSLTDKGVRRP